MANGTILATPVDKILLEGEPSLRAVHIISRAFEQASPIAQPAPALATSLPTTTMSAQTLSAIAQQQQSANSPMEVANAFGETLCTVNNDVSIIEIKWEMSAT
uniref:Uncharacterized protein n=1 Tax=Romanomermis culicivorax TaxID=13658 RepID=A0A915K1R0_ROMCU